MKGSSLINRRFLGLTMALLVATPLQRSTPTRDAGDARRCSRSSLPLPAYKAPQFLIRTTADTVRSPSNLNPPSYATEVFSDTLTSTAAYGQLMVIERLDSPFAHIAIGDTALFVPWGYAADCNLVRWESTAQWVTPNDRGIIWSTPRSESHWVGGRPTFDVLGWHAPYPQGSFLPNEYRVRGTSRSDWLNVDETWELYGLVPPSRDGDVSVEEVTRAIADWAAANPSLAERFPATQLMFWIERASTPN